MSPEREREERILAFSKTGERAALAALLKTTSRSLSWRDMRSPSAAQSRA